MFKQYALAITITAYEKSLALEPTGQFDDMAREIIRKLSER